MRLDVRRAPQARWSAKVCAAFADDAQPIRLRRATTLQIELQNDKFWIKSLLSGRSIRGAAPLVDTLRTWSDWRSTEDPWFHGPDGEPDPARIARIVRLVDLGIVVVDGSPFELLDRTCAFDWHWGPESAAFNFAIRDVQWGTPEQVVEELTARRAVDPGPELTHRHDTADPSTIDLPAPSVSTGVYETMARRASEREYSGGAIPLDALARTVHSGLGIINWSDEGPFGVLPHAMTPSGGARNPYEAYIAARAVDGLEPAVYHYSATQHSLHPVATCPDPLGDLLADLEWVGRAAAVIMLIADFRRTMWKYKHATAHRVVLIESGHIAQNMLLAATNEGLGSIPIAAFNDAVVENLLDLDPLHQLAAHAVVVGCSA